MTLTAKDVAEISRLLEASSFDELTLELEGLKLTLRRGGAWPLAAPIAADARSAEGGEPRNGAGHAAAAAVSANPSATPTPKANPNSNPNASANANTNASAGAGAGAGAGANADGAPAADRSGEAAQEVVAPLLGTFYRAPKPGAPPFVEIGSAVEPDTIVGIIEVMKLMNTVRAGTYGAVTDILAQDGALVEYGETLMRVSHAARD